MAKKKKKGNKGKSGGSNSGNENVGVGRNGGASSKNAREPRLHPETKNSIWAISLHLRGGRCSSSRGSPMAGPAGALIYQGLDALVGWGYLILPATLLFAAAVFLLSRQKRILATTLIGSTLLILSVLGLIELLSPTHGGWLGLVFGSLRMPFGNIAATTIDIFHPYYLRARNGERADQS